ncbi:hypothetical protein JW868_02555 [Candidatus Woesearchaeota archaeon]|nr:hypothetical protein [Candidatus Woesearchaeota archaeon]
MKSNHIILGIILVFVIIFYGCETAEPPVTTDGPGEDDSQAMQDDTMPVDNEECPAVCVPMYSRPDCTYMECGSGCGPDNEITFATLDECQAALGIVAEEETEQETETVPNEEQLVMGEGECKKTIDCDPKEVCIEGKCIHTDELVKIEYECVHVLEKNNNLELKYIILQIDQKKPGKMDWFPKFYLYTDESDPVYNVQVGTQPNVMFNYGYVGEKIIYPQMKVFPMDGQNRILRIEWFNNEHEHTRTAYLPIPNEVHSCE